MKSLSKLKIIATMALISLFTVSCDNDDDNTTIILPETITELAVATPQLSVLVDALERANLAATLDQAGTYTVFAPTNDAFTAFLSANNFASLNDVPVNLLTQVLLNHVIAQELPSTSLSTGYVSTLATQNATDLNLSMFVDTTNGVKLNGVSNVTAANIEATNGVIHLVDAVIGLPTVVDQALANPVFSSLVAALSAADGNLVNVLDGTGTFTVLAPTNDAFSAFLNGAALGDIPTDALANVLLNHVLGTVVTSTDLVDLGAGYTNTLATGPADHNLSLYFNTSDGVRFNGVSSVAAADVVTTNGIIHAIDAVIPIPTVVTFAVADPDFSTLVSALTTLTPATDFVSILSDTESLFTVFAPTDTAFSALASIPEETVLTQVLLHHVIGSANVTSGDLTPNGVTTAASLEGDDLTITLPGTGNNIADLTDGSGNTDIGIIFVDVQAGNGVIHVINKVAIPTL
ncbi:MAG: fasciclin domain-containing protein [Flavobacteriales bacterium]|nr:fasciclin domain-containing protein [Flavobacteriia bacterium]NCP05134.1 fasciclin domain-containing protein [Flavobacteriales bacterium]PIV93312.1 MAG: adhesin [Flavobacteriaceae bacterium CG17_big_fil_post_rev_8_21_14_2_50_33_15]PIY10365.1 MAG: adhesin [Flavobacteriaceae bacterium CG_4_10_14_3_um_filter_33_47]PJB20386.1 MAG: adhesin [Flavobacteriaceae bacterium CG_4_9_14_3_um_filter_33_16]